MAAAAVAAVVVAAVDAGIRLGKYIYMDRSLRDVMGDM